MARIEWVRQRLENWALWKEREQSGGLGFPTSSSFTREVTGGYRQCVIPVDEVEASITNDAVNYLQFTRSQLHLTLVCMYIDGLGINTTAQRLQRSPASVHAYLDQADIAIAQWLGERAMRRGVLRPGENM